MQYASYDGTLIWKITNFHEKMMDAQSERQTSIYSPPFYSSFTGYKMRARLYLNGDGNARRTHMSLFFVLMRGPNDAILKFPFNYKVTFCLYDQTPQQQHIIDSFRPDIKSNSFQRPRSEMNIASGIPKFFPLTMIQQEGNPYVREDTMFIKVMVDFDDMPRTLLPYALSLNPGLPIHIQQLMIKQETERRAQQQSQQTPTSLGNRPTTLAMPPNNEILRCELANYYQSKQHRDSIINVIRKMKLQLRNTQMTSNQMDTASLRTTTITDDSVAVNQLKELHKTINTLSNSTGTLSEDVKF
ncbi:unnamed protein product [Rotaria sp. Silwood1]|nr:unnamed protein product [Rotaria sp. Silwood1]CAF1065826.1 unnamed protein product [Rotaria sp. Silwood1]